MLGVLLRLRQYPLGLVADIEDMVNQVKVSPKDSDALRFLCGKITTFESLRVSVDKSHLWRQGLAQLDKRLPEASCRG